MYLPNFSLLFRGPLELFGPLKSPWCVRYRHQYLANSPENSVTSQVLEDFRCFQSGGWLSLGSNCQTLSLLIISIKPQTVRDRPQNGFVSLKLRCLSVKFCTLKIFFLSKARFLWRTILVASNVVLRQKPHLWTVVFATPTFRLTCRTDCPSVSRAETCPLCALHKMPFTTQPSNQSWEKESLAGSPLQSRRFLLKLNDWWILIFV